MQPLTCVITQALVALTCVCYLVSISGWARVETESWPKRFFCFDQADQTEEARWSWVNPRKFRKSLS